MTGPSLSSSAEPQRPAPGSFVPPPHLGHEALRYRRQVEAHGSSHGLPSTSAHAVAVTVLPELGQSLQQRRSGDDEPQHPAPTSNVVESSHQQAIDGAPSSRRNHGGNNLYACRDCGRSYSRPEHLVRHVQTHTLGRRFVCEICQKSFARKDLLHRHVANHENDSSSKRRRTTSSAAAAAAGRVSQACRPCAAARVKCDDSKPCRRCVTRDLACVYSDAGLSSTLHRSLGPHFPRETMAEAGPAATGMPTAAFDTSSSPASHGVSQSVMRNSGPGTSGSTSRSTPRSSAGSFKPDISQTPKPDVSLDQVTLDTLAQPAVANLDGAANFNASPFFDFLREVLYEQPLESDKMAATQQSMPVLDFCDDANLELTDVDFGMLDHWNLEGMADWTLPTQDLDSRQACAVDMNQMRKSLVKVWTESPWRWDPNANDNGYRDQTYFAVPSQETSSAQFQQSRDRLERVISERMDQSDRDRVMAILLSQCRDAATTDRVASSFPMVDVLDTLIHIFLAAHACQVDSWIHFPTFTLKQQWPEWMAMAAAHGGATIPIPTLRRFGMAVMEAVRITIPSRFEERNTAIRMPSLVQALILVQDLGLWSGNRRRMEIAECHLVIPVTMMRYRGRFQRSKYPAVHVDASDEGEVLQHKWKAWVESEQWKRLVFHCHLREAQISMTTLTNPCLSYAELTLPLPEARELWFASNAEDWKRDYMARSAGQEKRPPSLGDLMHGTHLLTQNYGRLDVQFSISIFLHGFWALILEYRQLSSVQRSRTYANGLAGNSYNLLLDSRHEQLVKDLESFQLMAANLPDMSAREHLLLNLLMMNLRVSMDDMQLFLGKEGEEQARRVYPILQQWTASDEARSAVCCAAQVLRFAKLFPPGHLKDFYAVALHHAAVTLWTFGVVTTANRREYMSSLYTAEVVYLDGADAMAAERFVGRDHVRPLMQGPALAGAAPQVVSLLDPRACMDVAQDILRANFISQGSEGMPPIVENLIQLIKQLGNAAWTVGPT